ncbi:hypothetical protein COL154_014199, partial [Colletotrichum chrysophilum]
MLPAPDATRFGLEAASLAQIDVQDRDRHGELREGVDPAPSQNPDRRPMQKVGCHRQDRLRQVEDEQEARSGEDKTLPPTVQFLHVAGHGVAELCG